MNDEKLKSRIVWSSALLLVFVLQKIDSSMNVLPPLPPIRLVKWMKNKAQYLGVDTEDLLEHYQIIGEGSRSRHFDVPETRVDIQNIEEYLRLQRLRDSNQWNDQTWMSSPKNEEKFLPWNNENAELHEELVRKMTIALG